MTFKFYKVLLFILKVLNRPKVYIEIDNDSKGPKRLLEDLTKWAYALNQKEREDQYRPAVIYLCASEEGAARVNNAFKKMSIHLQNQFNGFEAAPVKHTAKTLTPFL